MELGPFSGQINLIDASIPPNGLGLDVRPLTWGFVPFRFYGGYFWSTRSLPDGSWMLVRTWAYQRSAAVNFIAKVPPSYTPDSVARDRFVTVAVSARGPKGASRAMVKFGYAENGLAENYYCASRQEACVAVDTLGQRTGQVAISGGVATLQSGDPFDADTWKAGTKIQIMGSEWPIPAPPTPNLVSIGSQNGTGKVSANGSVVSFSNPGECVKHTIGTRITANGATVTVTNPWQCDGTATGNQVGVNTAVNWSSSAWTWDLGDLAGNTKPYNTTFHYAGETFNTQPCGSSGCTIRIPAISQRVLHYQVIYDNGVSDSPQTVAVSLIPPHRRFGGLFGCRCRSAPQGCHPALPLLAEFLPTPHHVRFGLRQIGESSKTLDRIARAAGSHQVARYLFTLVRPRLNKIHGHDQRVLKTGHAIQTAVLTAILVAFQNPATLFRGQRLGQTGQAEQVLIRHKTPPTF
jgi:hypothetical protein